MSETATTATAADTELRISFDPAHLLRLAPFIAQGDIRYYLNGVNVEPAPKGVYLTATNGHVLAVIHDSEGSMSGEAAAILKVTPQLLAAARAAAGRAQRLVPHRVLVMGQRLLVAPNFSMEGSDLELFVQPGKCVINGKFPNWRSVLPKFAELQRGGLLSGNVNAHYLALFDKVAPKHRRGVALWHHPEHPHKLVVQLEGAPEMVAVVMNMRADETDDVVRKRLPHIEPLPAPVETTEHPSESVNRDAEPVTDEADH